MNTHRGFGRRVEVEPVLSLLRTELSQGEDAHRHRSLPGAVRLQPQHQRAAVQLLETQREHERFHERHILMSRGRKKFFYLLLIKKGSERLIYKCLHDNACVWYDAQIVFTVPLLPQQTGVNRYSTCCESARRAGKTKSTVNSVITLSLPDSTLLSNFWTVWVWGWWWCLLIQPFVVPLRPGEGWGQNTDKKGGK